MSRATPGENLVKGLDNLLDDLDRGGGQLSIRQSADAFRIGENIATAPGKVVFRNALIELLQFDPTTEKVYERPLLIFPPWINKFYILDLRPENSFIRWAVDQGYTVFIASWVNPDRKLAQKTFEDYMREGIFAALDAVRDATGVEKVNTIGYCIGGTLLSATLAYMAATKDDRINSATFFAAQADFSEAGDLQVFIDDEQLDALQQQMENDGGVLEGRKMGTTFKHAARQRSHLVVRREQLSARARSDAVRPALLEFRHDAHAGGDASVLSAAILQEQRALHRQDELRQRQARPLQGEGAGLSAKREGRSHRALPFGLQIHPPVRRAGPLHHRRQRPYRRSVINPPNANKYQFWTNDKFGGEKGKPYPAAIEDWQAGTTETPGSWWGDWDKWLSKLSGKKVPARKPGDGKLKVLGDAPGTYVKVKAG